MAEELGTDAGQQQQQQMQLMVDDRELKTVYSNAYQIHATADEVIVDLGFNMAVPNPRQQGQQALLLKLTDRVVMSYTNAKRLALSLGQLIKRYEQQFGELPSQPGQRPPQR